MSLRLEQNWKWSKKTFLHISCVVSPWDETNHSGICLVSSKNLSQAKNQEGEGRLGLKKHFWGHFAT